MVISSPTLLSSVQMLSFVCAPGAVKGHCGLVYLCPRGTNVPWQWISSRFGRWWSVRDGASTLSAYTTPADCLFEPFRNRPAA